MRVIEILDTYVDNYAEQIIYNFTFNKRVKYKNS